MIENIPKVAKHPGWMSGNAQFSYNKHKLVCEHTDIKDDPGYV